MQGLLFNENYELEVKSDLPIPKPGKNQALIKILAVSLNRRDFWITQGLYPNLKVIGKMKLSFTIRGEKKGC
jgi:NADPH:quinone reductase-like Zn-dependent oxidoreductase